MAKSRSSQAVTRSRYPIARPRLSTAVYRLPSVSSILGDRRVFHPLQSFRPADYVGRRIARSLVLKPAVKGVKRFNGNVWVPDKLAFRDPFRVLICARRAIRKEVLFAKEKAGFGSGSNKPKNRGWFSDVSCKSR